MNAMALNILWCKVCKTATSWHLIGLSDSLLVCDRCHARERDELLKLTAAAIIEIDGRRYREACVTEIHQASESEEWFRVSGMRKFNDVWWIEV